MSIEGDPNPNQAPDLERGSPENGEDMEQKWTEHAETDSQDPDGQDAPPPLPTVDKNDTFATASLPYSCHEKGRASKVSYYQGLSTYILQKIGKRKKRRMVHPMYRKHRLVNLPKASVYDILAQECMEQLYDDAPNGNFGSIGFLSFTRLHHLNLHYFEAELTREMTEITAKKTTDRKQILKVRRLLRHYSRAIQDYEFLGQHLQQPSENQLTKFHSQLLPGLVEHIKSPQNAWDNGYIMIGTSHRWTKAIFGRILAALLGGFALIVPMIIMSLDDSVEKSLITASVSVVVVAIIVALASSGSSRDVLNFTAAYAAVLVVFVGTSLSSQDGASPKAR